MSKPNTQRHNSSAPLPEQDPSTKRPYRAPALRVLGDFRKLTAAKGGNMNDGGSKPNTRRTGPDA